MTQVFMADGTVVPVTRVLAGPCQITQVRVNDKKVQLGFDKVREFRINKPETGHLKDLELVGFLREFKVENTDNLKRGDVVLADTFVAGDVAEVMGISKGKGFAGVVKRHHFAGAPASHGHKHDLRAPGSIGAGGVQRVFKGMRMAGRMGGDQVTVKNLKIVEVHADSNELYIKGAVPGGRNSMLVISAPGELKIKQTEITNPSVEVAVEASTQEENKTE